MLRCFAVGLILACLSFANEAHAISVGQYVYIKPGDAEARVNPDPMSAPVWRIPWGEALKVVQIKKRWLFVSSPDRKLGWVYGGSVSASVLPDANQDDYTRMMITTAPQHNRAIEYAERNNLLSAASDVQWLHDELSSVTDDHIMSFIMEQKRGEFSR